MVGIKSVSSILETYSLYTCLEYSDTTHNKIIKNDKNEGAHNNQPNNRRVVVTLTVVAMAASSCMGSDIGGSFGGGKSP
jgi:hypothetical protein